MQFLINFILKFKLIRFTGQFKELLNNLILIYYNLKIIKFKIKILSLLSNQYNLGKLIKPCYNHSLHLNNL